MTFGTVVVADEVGSAMMDAKQHAEVMDALHTIGRNIAQQDASRTSAISTLTFTLNMWGIVAAILWIVSMSARGAL